MLQRGIRGMLQAIGRFYGCNTWQGISQLLQTTKGFCDCNMLYWDSTVVTGHREIPWLLQETGILQLLQARVGDSSCYRLNAGEGLIASRCSSFAELHLLYFFCSLIHQGRLFDEYCVFRLPWCFFLLILVKIYKRWSPFSRCPCISWGWGHTPEASILNSGLW